MLDSIVTAIKTKLSNRNGSFTVNTIKLLSGNLAGQFVIIATIPIITRLYTPAMFGVFAFFVTVSQVFASFSHLRYANAILKPKDDVEAANTLWLSLSIGLLMILFCWLFVQILPQNLSSWSKYGISQHIVSLIFISSFIGSMILSMNFWMIRKKYFSFLAVVRVLDAMISRLSMIGCAFIFQASPLLLCFSFIAGQLISFIVLCYVSVFGGWKLLKNSFRAGALKNQAVKFKSFALYSPSILFNSARREFPVLAMAFFFDPATVGYYALCQRVVGQPLGILGDALSRSFFQKAAELHHRDQNINDKALKLLKFQILIAITPCVLMAVVSHELFALVFGENWQKAGDFFLLTWPFFICPFIFRPLSVLYDLYDKQREYLLFNIILFVFSVMGFLFGVVMDGPYLSVFLFTVMNVIFTASAILFILNHIGCPVSSIAKTVVEPITYSLVFGGIAWIGKFTLFLGNLESVIFAIILGAIFLISIAMQYLILGRLWRVMPWRNV